MAMPARDSPPLCSLTIPQVGSGACLSAGAKGVTPKVVCTSGHWGLLWPSAFLRQGESNQMQGVIFLSHLALLGERLIERLVLHNEF